MKARVTFYFAVVVALVLFLACVPSHATERRDPILIQDGPQAQAARSSSMARAATLGNKPAQSSRHKAKGAASPENDQENVDPVSVAREKSAGNTKASGLGDGAPTKDTAAGSNMKSK